MDHIRIGGERSGFLALSIKGRERPDSTDFWDANWLSCSVEVATGTFHAVVDSSLRTDELEGFHGQIARLHATLVGEAELTTMEGWLDLRLVGDGRGHVDATGRLCDDRASGNSLEFHLELDQTFLPPILRQLSVIPEAYPIVHRQPGV